MAAEIMDDNTQVDYRIKISGKAPLKKHKGRFNAPSVSEVAIMIAGELGDRRDTTFSLGCQSKGLANPKKKGVPLADFPRYVTDNALGRVYTAHPNNREAFHMRLLLHHVRGPISFENLKTVIVRDEDGDILEIKPCSTYTEACWDCWKVILICTRQWKRQLCLSHQHNSITSLPFWLPYVA
ncbi:hypothetical protein TNIN_485841 [Trichonephila inaurata madagascariensis]|uniref:Uncharacterized protein n=1 Tax=Trichonephila inaurata madagascariensis TaxID=2747483 RepID=A0A8X6X001_9ARAC|nr:hypothetical protein TNIN_485841 [Trichonephila inaurata madagascariensis]